MLTKEYRCKRSTAKKFIVSIQKAKNRAWASQQISEISTPLSRASSLWKSEIMSAIGFQKTKMRNHNLFLDTSTDAETGNSMKSLSLKCTINNPINFQQTRSIFKRCYSTTWNQWSKFSSVEQKRSVTTPKILTRSWRKKENNSNTIWTS